MNGRIAILLLLAAVTACGGSPEAAATPAPPAASPSPSPSPTEGPGPGGMTLDEEIGAVMMVGFQGSLTPAVLDDWTRHQYGGLLIVNNNHNASTAAGMTSLIATLRGAKRHRLLAATDQEGGQVCLAISTVPCAAMPVDRAGTTTMAKALRALGFDVDLGPVSDVCSGPSSIMWGRCYGTTPAVVAGYIGPVIDGIHSAGMLSAAKHFPGHGDTSVSSETRLPRIYESLQTLQSRDFPPFIAAVAHHTDFVLMGHLFYPAIDPHRSADLSPETFLLLRKYVGFRDAILSDDMEMGAITASTPTPEAAVEFLIAGGDMVIVAHNLSVADATYDAIKKAVQSGRLPRERLDEAVAALAALRNG
jgi:beta-N-acetylhexosaminidase